MRRRVGAVAIAASLMLLAGCEMLPFGFACSAIGYSSVAIITLSDPAPGLTLELCDGAGCLPGPVEQPMEGGSLASAWETGVMSLTGDSATGWRASMLGGQPVLGYRLTAEDGTVAAEGSIDVEWRRIDGTERCGGNTEAVVELPA